MNCYLHYDRKATKRCGECGRYICDECGVEINKVTYCKSCVAQMAEQKKFNNYNAHNTYSYEARTAKPVHPPRRGGLNSFLLFCMSAIPGLNYMYLGLLKRGMFFMSLFFGMIFVAASFDLNLLIFAVFIEMCYSFFDGFRIRRRLLEGFEVPDTIDDFVGYFNVNKRVIVTGFLIATALSLTDRFSRLFSRSLGMFFGGNSYWIVDEMFSVIMGICIIVFGCLIIFRGSGKKSDNYKNDNQQEYRE